MQVNVTGLGLATIYSDDGITPKSNPMLSDGNGRFDFFVANGRYDLQFSGTGFTTFTETNVEISDAMDLTALGKTPIAFTGNNSHSGTETFTGPVLCKNFETIRCIDVVNSAGWGGVNGGAWIGSAISDLIASSPNGGDIFITPGTYVVASTINVNSPNVNIHCAGGAHGFADAGPAPTPATLLSWGGGAAPVVQWATTSGAANQVIEGGGLDGCAIYGNSTATTGLLVNTVRGATFRNLTLINFAGPAVKLGVVAQAADARDVQFNLFQNIQCKQADGGIADSQDCFQLTGDSSANSSLNRFINLRTFTKNGNGVTDSNGDNNVFIGFSHELGAFGAGKGIRFTGSGSLNTAAREETVVGFNGGAGVQQDGTATANAVYGYHQGNGASLPIVTNGQFFFTNDGIGGNAGTITMFHGSGGSDNMVIFDSSGPGQNEDILWNDSGTPKWAVGKNTTNDWSVFDSLNNLQRVLFSAGTNGNTTVSAPGAGVVRITSNGITANATQTIANGTSAMAASTITAATCQTAITTLAAGAVTTDAIEWAYATAPTLTTDALLTISPYATSGNVNFIRCNPTNASITGTGIVINWRVIR